MRVNGGYAVVFGFVVLLLLSIPPTLAGADDIASDFIDDIVGEVVHGDSPSAGLNDMLQDMHPKLSYFSQRDSNKAMCERAANAVAYYAIGDMKRTRILFGFFDVAVNVELGILTLGTSGLKSFILSKGREFVEDAVREKLSEQPSEVVVYDRGGDCNQKITAIWNKPESRITVLVDGDCECKQIRPDIYYTATKGLADYSVRIDAKVTQKIILKTKKKFLFFNLGSDKILVEYGVGAIKVTTGANCCTRDGRIIGDPVEETDGVDDSSGIDEVIDYTADPEDGEIEEDGTEDDDSKKDTDVCADGEITNDFDACRSSCHYGECTGRKLGDGSPLDATYCYTCKAKCEKGTFYDTPNCRNTCADGEVCEDLGNSCFSCNSLACPKGTYKDVLCDGKCALNQECSTLSSKKVGDRFCNACEDKCPSGEFYNRKFCNALCADDETCTASGDNCFACEKNIGDVPEEVTNKLVNDPSLDGSCVDVVKTIGDKVFFYNDPTPYITAEGKNVLFTIDSRCETAGNNDYYDEILQSSYTDYLTASCPALSYHLEITDHGSLSCTNKYVFTMP